MQLISLDDAQDDAEESRETKNLYGEHSGILVWVCFFEVFLVLLFKICVSFSVGKRDLR